MIQSDPALLARRLQRLREAHPGVGERRPPSSPRSADGAEARAGDLARGLGGRVEKTAVGPVVSLESSFHVPLQAVRLAALPFPIDPGRPLVLLDTETTGLGTGTGTLPFLVGLGWWDGAELRVRQLFLPDHADERAFLAAVAAALPTGPWLVTYNGRAFDWPLLCARFRLHRMVPPDLVGHLDLLPVARQLWRHRLPDARLATVEAGVAGVRRGRDLPGALVPERYFAWLRSRRASVLREVAEHNRRDVVSLGWLLFELAHRLAPVEPALGCHPGDLAALGRSYSRRGRYEEALRCVEAAFAAARWPGRGGSPGPMPPRAGVRLDHIAAQRAHLLARLGRRSEALRAWLELADRGGALAVQAWLQVAKHREHDGDDAAGALAAAQRAQALVDRLRVTGHATRPWERDLERRLPRLRRRVAGGSAPGGSLPAGLVVQLAQSPRQVGAARQARQPDPFDREAGDDRRETQRPSRGEPL